MGTGAEGGRAEGRKAAPGLWAAFGAGGGLFWCLVLLVIPYEAGGYYAWDDLTLAGLNLGRMGAITGVAAGCAALAAALRNWIEP